MSDSRTTTRPNILLIHADQHRRDCLGAAGNPDVRTPHIDGLAAGGTYFENHFCPFPVCTASRYSMLTGLHPQQHLGYANGSTIPAGIPTLPRALRDGGYRTAAVGKMHFGPTYLDVGFQTMLLAEQCGPGRYDDDYHRWLRKEGLVDRVDLMDQVGEYRKQAPAAYWDTYGALRSDLDEEHHSTTWIGNRAVEQIEGWTGGGNFMMVGFIKPHHPFDPPAPWDEAYNPDALTLLPGWTESLVLGDSGKGYFDYAGMTEAQLRRVMAFYYATISQIDHHVGRMVELLRRKGLYDNTLIVYTSDHGDHMGFHHRILKGYAMLDPLVRIPLVIKWPDGTPMPPRQPALSSNTDLAPTLLAAAGVEKPRSMTDMLLSHPDAGRDCVFAQHGPSFMARTAARKLILGDGPRRSMLFDLEKDPLEMRNVIADPAYADDAAALRERLLQWALFEARAHSHFDPDAPQRPSRGAPDQHVALEQYFARRMEEPCEFHVE